jgi:hypothetical protein
MVFMNRDFLPKLFRSLEDLEAAINGARNNLLKKNEEELLHIPRSIWVRLDSYNDILNKQRSLALELGSLLILGRFEEVNQKVIIINNLSSMIRDDAKEVLSLFTKNLQSDPEVSGTVEISEESTSTQTYH